MSTRQMPPPVQARKTRYNSWAPSGWLVSSSTPQVCTYFTTLSCPDDFLAVRAGFTNIHPEPFVITKVIAAASTTPGDYANPTGVSFWRPLTFANGGLPVDQIVTDSAVPTNITVRGCQREQRGDVPAVPSWTWTDWVPLASLRRTDSPDAPRILTIRILLPAGCRHTHPNGGFSEFNAIPEMNRGASYAGGHVWADVVTVPGIISAPNASIGIAYPTVSCVQFLTRNEGYVGMTTGDSHHQGTSTTTQFWNYLSRSALELSSRHVGRIPFGYWSTAQGGTTSDWFFSCLTNVLDVARPGFVVLPGWTYNDMTINVHADHAANLVFLSRLLMTAETCVRAGAVPIFLTPFPRDPVAMTPVQVGAWRSLRESIRSLRENGAIVLDAASILARQSDGEMDGTYLPDYTDDTAHPNNSGHAAIATALTSIIERLCGLN
jgi:hypothetical protein